MPDDDYLKGAAFEAHRTAQQLLDAARTLGWSADRLERLVVLTGDLDHHFNPSVRVGHGQAVEG
jgi:hypothetical protein